MNGIMFFAPVSDRRLMKYFILIALLSTTAWGVEVDHDYKMRVSWVKTLKELFLEIENKDLYKLSSQERTFRQDFFSFMDLAWAETDSRYNCFYGGWPSSRKGKFCQTPVKGNSNYTQGSCKAHELQCQPLLFGKGLCASAKTSAERNKTFSNCEKKFQKEKGGSFEFLRTLSRNELQDLHELSTTAGEICSKDLKQHSICKKILSKVSDGLRSIDQGFRQLETNNVVPSRPASARSTISVKSSPSPPHSEDCPSDEHSHGLNENSFLSLQTAATSEVDALYQELKEEFLGSPFCDPHSIISNPAEKPSPVITAKLMKDLVYFDFMNPQSGDPEEGLSRLRERYLLSQKISGDVLPLLQELKYSQTTPERRELLKAQAQALIVQDFFKNYRHNPEFMKAEIMEELSRKNILKKNEVGEIECPFMTKDAFLKALAGRDEVLKSHGGRIKKKNVLTIVDYTRPSNERRMFVIDLEAKKVLHNTWVAHGAGGGYHNEGSDGKGGSPPMSNTSGSNLSSDGFVIASHASSGRLFGPNVILQGIDKNNSNMQRRAVILHKWGSPYQDYSAGIQDYIDATDSYGPRYDINDHFKSTDFTTAGNDEIRRSLRGLHHSVYASSMLGGTQGCLGVPENNIRHLDRKGRNTSQLEALREDLPGTLIFNYSGSDMRSKFF